MSDTWNKYCEKLEELRRLEDEARKRRKVAGSAGVEIIDKTRSISAGVPDSVEGASGKADKGDSNG